MSFSLTQWIVSLIFVGGIVFFVAVHFWGAIVFLRKLGKRLAAPTSVEQNLNMLVVDDPSVAAYGATRNAAQAIERRHHHGST